MKNKEVDNRNLKAWKDRLLKVRSSYESALNLLEWCEIKNYKRGIADACRTLSYCYWRFSDYSLSLSHSLRALKIYQELSDKKGEADTLNNIGAVYMFQNDHQKRLEVNLKCQQLRWETGDLEGVASSEGNIGETYLEMGDYVNAEKRFQSVLNNPNASPQGRAWAYHNIGKVGFLNKDWAKALNNFQMGLDLSVSVNYEVLICDSYLELTNLYIRTEDYDSAIHHAEKALLISREIGAKEGEKKALYYLSLIYELKKQFEESLRYHKDYHTIDVEISRDTEIERLKTAQMKFAYDKIEEQKNELIGSIRYAEQIQRAVLTRDQYHTLITNYFVFYQPKDIVSGDFYWYHEKDNTFYLCVADCTGHGVPGAFLTMLGTTFLNEIITLNEDPSPAFILEDLRMRIIKSLSLSESERNKDGMDISMIRINIDTLQAEWAGAYNPLWVIRENDFEKGDPVSLVSKNEYHLMEWKGDKQPIAFVDNPKPFLEHRIQLKKGDRFYLFSDGYSDQFGGKEGKKFKSINFKQLLLDSQNLSMEEQGKLLADQFNNWKNQLDQVDDVCVLGIEL